MFKQSIILFANGYLFITKLSYNLARRRHISYLGRLNDRTLDMDFCEERNKLHYDQFDFNYWWYLKSAYRHRGILVPIRNDKGEWVWFPHTHNPYDFSKDEDGNPMRGEILPFYKEMDKLYVHDLHNEDYTPRYLNTHGFMTTVKDVTQDSTKILNLVPEARSGNILEEGLTSISELLDQHCTVKDLDLASITPVEVNVVLTKEEILNISKIPEIL